MFVIAGAKWASLYLNPGLAAVIGPEQVCWGNILAMQNLALSLSGAEPRYIVRGTMTGKE